VLRGDVEHAFHPGGGLHHAMPDRASGFCIYDDPALAISRVRREGLRVLYLDFDVHHGDGVQAIHWADPGVLTLSFHESGRYLFPGTGFVGEIGEGEAAGTSLNFPFEPGAGEGAWVSAVSSLVPAVAAAFGPDVVVSQHGCDTHAWDPLADLRLTTTAMGEAARLVDRVAHRWAGGRWLSTGGGGYDAYRVVPRAWSLVWLAGAHLPAPATTPLAWRERWVAEATRFGQAPLPSSFIDEPNAGEPVDGEQRAAEEASLAGLGLVEMIAVPALLREASRRGWWDAAEDLVAGAPAARSPVATGNAKILDPLTAAELSRLSVAPRVMALFDPTAGKGLLHAALRADSVAVAAVAGDTIVGLALVGSGGPPRQLLALGVAPAFRRQGLAGALLNALAARVSGEIEALVTVAERDPVEPLDHALRASIARRLFERAGFTIEAAPSPLARVDPHALRAIRR
jgi:ribosomal protein S18 acetylase RimI-like enzyme